MKEYHLFIIWEKALKSKRDLLEKIEDKFNIISSYVIKWNEDKFSENLSRFYGTKLPDYSYKEEHVGKGEFLLIVVEDPNPFYDFRETSKGRKKVNVNMFDTKSMMREMTGGGHRIHGTDSQDETNHDLTLLLDLNVDDFLKKIINEGRDIELPLTKDLFGANGWNNTLDIFYALNNCSEYVIMRNHENLPEDVYVNDHNDIDILCLDDVECAYVLNAEKVFDEPNRVHYQTLMQERKVFFDLRFVGDQYYCVDLEKRMLLNRELSKKGFYILPKDEYFFTLLYHALLHKQEFTDDYKERLQKMKLNCIGADQKHFMKILSEWLIKYEYNVYNPLDVSVLFNEDNAKKLSPLLYHLDENVIKPKLEQLAGLEIENEKLNQIINKIYQSKRWVVTEKIRKIFRL